MTDEYVVIPATDLIPGQGGLGILPLVLPLVAAAIPAVTGLFKKDEAAAAAKSIAAIQAVKEKQLTLSQRQAEARAAQVMFLEIAGVALLAGAGMFLFFGLKGKGGGKGKGK